MSYKQTHGINWKHSTVNNLWEKKISLHLTFFAPLKRSRFYTNTWRSFIVWWRRQHIVRATNQLSGWIETVAQQTYGWICCDSATLQRFPISKQQKHNSLVGVPMAIDCICLLWLICFFLTIAQDYSHVSVACKVVIALHVMSREYCARCFEMVFKISAIIAARRNGRCCIQWRHASHVRKIWNTKKSDWNLILSRIA